MLVEHGLSLYVELDNGQKLLFDMGQSGLFADNAQTLGLSIAAVDLAVVSHGHYDHGGGLARFLALNRTAKVYLHRDAFLPHYSMKETGLRFIGIDGKLQSHSQLCLCDDCTSVGEGMTLFAAVKGQCCNPVGNRLLYGPDKSENDDFGHEQSLIIEENGKTVLLAGCAHRGIVNIMRRATEVIGHAPTHVLAGMHLVKSGLAEPEERAFVSDLSRHLMAYGGCRFYTMHCTGTEQYDKLKSMMGEQIEYLSCGDSVTI